MSGAVKQPAMSTGVAATGAGQLPIPTYFNMDGKWQIIKERSESLYTHMKALGCDEIAALASEKLDIWLNIEHSPDNPVIRIYQTSQLGTTLRILNTTKEVAEQSVQTDARVVRTSSGVFEGSPALIISTVFKSGSLRDTRVLVEGGKVMKTVLELSAVGHNIIRTVRYFRHMGAVDREMMARVKDR